MANRLYCSINLRELSANPRNTLLKFLFTLQEQISNVHSQGPPRRRLVIPRDPMMQCPYHNPHYPKLFFTFQEETGVDIPLGDTHNTSNGALAEWFKAADSKSAGQSHVPRVRIPDAPPPNNAC